MRAHQVFLIFLTILIIMTTFLSISFMASKQLFYIINKKISNINYKLYLVLFWIFSILTLLAYFSLDKINYKLNILLFEIGSLWLVMAVIIVVIDILFLLFKKILSKCNCNYNLVKKLLSSKTIPVIIAFILIVLGNINARNIKLTTYDLNINKKSILDELNMVFISDIHGGVGHINNPVSKLADKINSLNPDVVIIGGDIIDEYTTKEMIDIVSKEFNKISSKYGTYAVLGNHDFAKFKIDELSDIYSNSSVNFLYDNYIKIEDIILLGLSDSSVERDNIELTPIKDILVNEDTNSSPVIAINHKPTRDTECIENNIDLMISGHTHNGQIFPGNIFVSILNDYSYGYYSNERLQSIVSSGFGTWVIPLRLGSIGEIVNIKLSFNN